MPPIGLGDSAHYVEPVACDIELGPVDAFAVVADLPGLADGLSVEHGSILRTDLHHGAVAATRPGFAMGEHASACSAAHGIITLIADRVAEPVTHGERSVVFAVCLAWGAGGLFTLAFAVPRTPVFARLDDISIAIAAREPPVATHGLAIVTTLF
jgi:hypothetical protein